MQGGSHLGVASIHHSLALEQKHGCLGYSDVRHEVKCRFLLWWPHSVDVGTLPERLLQDMIVCCFVKMQCLTCIIATLPAVQ